MYYGSTLKRALGSSLAARCLLVHSLLACALQLVIATVNIAIVIVVTAEWSEIKSFTTFIKSLPVTHEHTYAYIHIHKIANFMTKPSLLAAAAHLYAMSHVVELKLRFHIRCENGSQSATRQLGSLAARQLVGAELHM